MRKGTGHRGFTLIELLMVIAIIVLLMATMTSMFGWVIERSRLTTTEGRVHTIGCKLVVEVRLEGRVPPALIDLEPSIRVRQWVKEGQFVDAWENSLQYVPSGTRFRLWSMGPDGISGNSDDIKFAD